MGRVQGVMVINEYGNAHMFRCLLVLIVLLYQERIRGKLKDVSIHAVNFDLRLFPLGFKRR